MTVQEWVASLPAPHVLQRQNLEAQMVEASKKRRADDDQE